MSEGEGRGPAMVADGEDGWAVKRERRFTLALGASPAQRLAWLEQMIALAWQTGALPKRRSDAQAYPGAPLLK